MTKRECAIVMAYTGICMLQGDDLDLFYDYIREKLGRSVYTHELGTRSVQDELQQACRADFLDICKNATTQEKEKRCNECGYYEGVHGVQGHAPCSLRKLGSVFWNDHCRGWEYYKKEE